MANIDSFQHYAADILASLYENFPLPHRLSSNALAKSAMEKRPELGPIRIPDPTRAAVHHDPDATCESPAFIQQRAIARHTILWLFDCGYIRSDETIDRQHYKDHTFVLSPRGFEALAIVPLENKKSYGEQLQEVAKSGAGEAGKAAISEIIGGVIGAAFRASGLGAP